MRALFPLVLVGLLSLLCDPSLAVAAASGPPVAQTSTPNGTAINMWGDSLTAGGEDQVQITFETALSLGLGLPVTNNGIGSQKSTQVAMRQGGVPVQLTFSGNKIIYSVQNVTALNGVVIAGMATNQDPDYRFLSNTSGDTGQIVLGSVCGVHGNLVISGSGGPPSVSQQYLFTPDGLYPANSVLYATPYVCPANSVFTPDVASQQRVQPAIFWYGRNNNPQVAQIQSDLAGSIAYLGHTNYLCLTIPNAETEPSGSSAYAAIVSANAGITSTCGAAHTFDIREYLVSQYNPANPMDVLDNANDVVPYSYRAITGRGVLNGSLGSTGCPTLTAYMGGVGVGVMSVDSEYINITATSGSTVTACTRAYGTGGVVATHTSGANFTITDNLHLGYNGDQLGAAYVASHYKTALLGSTQSAVPTSAAVGGVLNFPNTVTAPWQFTYPIYAGNGEVWLGTNCITQAWNGFPNNLSGPLNNILCSSPGSGTITIGGSYNTLLCFTMGGQGPCTAGQSGAGLLFSTVGYEDQGYTYNTTATSGSTVVMANTVDTLDLNVGALTALTVQLPACSSGYNGKVVHIDTSGAITTLTLTATSGTVGTNASPGTLTRSMAAKCNGAQTTWFAY